MARCNRRSGYTLLELLLVMAVLVMLGAVFYPSLESSYGYFKVSAAADSIKGAWAQARARAIQDSTPYRFAVLPGTTRYRVAPDRPEFWSGNPPDPTDADNPPLILNGKLDGITFDLSGNAPPSGERNKDEDSDKAPANPSAYVAVAVFLTDGTAREDAVVPLQAPGAKPIKLKLRALTGTFKTETSKEDR